MQQLFYPGMSADHIKKMLDDPHFAKAVKQGGYTETAFSDWSQRVNKMDNQINAGNMSPGSPQHTALMGKYHNLTQMATSARDPNTGNKLFSKSDIADIKIAHETGTTDQSKWQDIAMGKAKASTDPAAKAKAALQEFQHLQGQKVGQSTDTRQTAQAIGLTPQAAKFFQIVASGAPASAQSALGKAAAGAGGGVPVNAPSGSGPTGISPSLMPSQTSNVQDSAAGSTSYP